MAKQDLKDLFIKANTGDEKAYHQFLEEILTLARAYVAYKISNANQREDIVQEILISVHRARHTFEETRAFKPWLYAIFRYRTLDYLRQIYRNKEDSIEGFIENTADDTNNNVTKQVEANELLSKALGQLNEKQRRILILIKLEGFTTAEVALKMDMNVSAVKVTVHRAIQKIRKTLT
ncbi:MAG: RNA polymerase sigma-70 factor (ECF subfamily) [Alphaproteobacteria bacterium]